MVIEEEDDVSMDLQHSQSTERIANANLDMSISEEEATSKDTLDTGSLEDFPPLPKSPVKKNASEETLSQSHSSPLIEKWKYNKLPRLKEHLVQVSGIGIATSQDNFPFPYHSQPTTRSSTFRPNTISKNSSSSTERNDNSAGILSLDISII